MDNGIPSVLAKLAAKIRRGEFVEMGELLPDFWSGPKEEDMDSRREIKTRHSRKVVDIYIWVQCFSTYVCGYPGPAGPSAYPQTNGVPGDH